MIQTETGASGTPPATAPRATLLPAILSEDRIRLGMTASSKKRLLEAITALLVEQTALDPARVFQILTERERLGSTGIGEGVALPHGRVAGLQQAIGAFATLAAPIDYDAQDKQPVSLVFGLLIPTEANAQHLAILAQLAAMFHDPHMRDTLRMAKDTHEVYHRLIA